MILFAVRMTLVRAPEINAKFTRYLEGLENVSNGLVKHLDTVGCKMASIIMLLSGYLTNEVLSTLNERDEMQAYLG